MTLYNTLYMNKQLPLSFQAPEFARFDNFIITGNQQLLHALIDEHESLIFLWGEHGCGKSHLLQAVTQSYQADEKAAFYLPLAQLQELTPDMLDGLEMMDLVCLDDVHAVSGYSQWEEALFHFFNRIRDKGGRLILAADNSAVNCAIKLPDLRSRLSWGLTYQVQALDDQAKVDALKLRASQRGMQMSNEVAAYIMKHTTRSLPELIILLDKLDYASLAEQRKLTIPFVKNIIYSV